MKAKRSRRPHYGTVTLATLPNAPSSILLFFLFYLLTHRFLSRKVNIGQLSGLDIIVVVLERYELNRFRILSLIVVGMIAISPLFSQFGSSPSIQSEIAGQPVVEMESVGEVPYLPSYEPHDRILISDDLDWEEQNIPGAGTEADPYVIENLEISGNFDCLYIIYTSKYYVIRNCFLHPEYSYREGIHINHADHGRIENCIIESAYYGIYALQTNSLVITNNTISGCDLYGIRLSTTSNCVVTHNRIHDTVSYGIYCVYSNNRFQNNTFWNTPVGLYMSSCTSGVIHQNIFWNSSTGAIVSASSSVTVSNNTFHDNFNVGFRNSGNDNIIFENNTIYNNKGYGVYWNAGNGAIIRRNYISGNSNFGFYLYYSRNCYLTSNEFVNDGLECISEDILDYNHTLIGNRVNGKDLGYFFSVNDIVIEGDSYGQILAANCTRLVIQGGTMSQTDTGIAFYYCNNSTVNSTTISGQMRGVYLYVSDFCNVTRTTMENCGVYIVGDSVNKWVHNFAETTVNGKPLGYFYEASNLTLDDNSLGQIIIVNSNHIEIKNHDISRASMGIAIVYSSNCNITENTIADNDIGLRLQECSTCKLENSTIQNSTTTAFVAYYSNECILKNVTILDSGYGLHLYSCSDFLVNESVISSNTYGTYLSVTDNLNFSHCSFENNYQAINTFHYDNSTIYDCDILSNAYIGIKLYYSDWITIRDGIIANNGNDGIDCTSSTYGEIIGNIVSHNQADGISFYYGDYYQVINNTLEGNSAYGINLDAYSDYNTVFGNNLSMNLDGNGYAYQNTNTWDDSVSMGNWWDDYVGPGAYSIPGPGNNVDRYPQSHAVFLPDHNNESFQFDSVGASFTWASFATEPDYFIVYIDDVVYDEGDWNGSEITVNVNTSSLGTFKYTLFVNGTFGTYSQDTVWVTIYDNAPIIWHPGDQYYNFDTTGHFITWVVDDANPFAYYLYIDETLDSWSVWTGAIPQTSIDGLQIGEYNYTLLVNDTNGNSGRGTVFVFVFDTAPAFEGPNADIVYNVGSTGHSILWSATDLNPANYTVYNNSEIYTFSPWDGEPITTYVDGLAIGVYNYTIVLVDTSGLTTSRTVFVTVQEPVTTTTTTTSTTTSNPTSTTTITSEPTTTTSEGTNPPMEITLIVIVSVASLAIILIVVILIIKKKT